MGSFIATFVYAVIALRFVRDQDESVAESAATDLAGAFVPQLSVWVATILMGISIAVLVYLLNHIPASIRINTVIEGIGRRLLRDVTARFERAPRGRRSGLPSGGFPVGSEHAGYVQVIDFAGLDLIAKGVEGRITLRVRTGDFVHPSMPLAELSRDDVDDSTREDLRGCFTLGGTRSAEQNLEFLIDELVEIALRALSPGINDPFTAMTAMHWLGAAMTELGRRDLCPGPDHDLYDPDRVQPLVDDFAHFLSLSFGAVRSGAATHPIAAVKCLDQLNAVATASAFDDRRATLQQEAERLMAQAREALRGPSLSDVEAHYANLWKTQPHA